MINLHCIFSMDQHHRHHHHSRHNHHHVGRSEDAPPHPVQVEGNAMPRLVIEPARHVGNMIGPLHLRIGSQAWALR